MWRAHTPKPLGRYRDGLADLDLPKGHQVFTAFFTLFVLD